jgi:hypothetical protein
MANKTENKTTSKKDVIPFEDYLKNNEDGQTCALMNKTLIKRELNYFNSKENRDKDNLIQKIGPNDESYKMIVRNIKYNCCECDAEHRESIESFFVNTFVEGLIKIGAMKKASIKFQNKTLIGMDFQQFRKAQTRSGRQAPAKRKALKSLIGLGVFLYPKNTNFFTKIG